MESEMQKLLPKVSLVKDNLATTSFVESSGEEWTDDDDSCSSYYSETESSDPEWEALIEPNGDLFYIDCHPFVDQQAKEPPASKNVKEASKDATKSTRGKFLKLLRRRDSKRRSKRHAAKKDASTASSSDHHHHNHHHHHQNSHYEGVSGVNPNAKVKFQDCQEGELREVMLKIDQSSRHKLGRRATLVEALLGLMISPFSDGARIMVAGFLPDSDPTRYRNIKIGDWLKCINEKEVNLQNVNEILNNLGSERTEVCLKLQRVAGVEVTKDPPANELKNQSYFVRHLTTFVPEENQLLMKLFIKQPLGILYLNIESMTESGPEFEGVLYCYPKPMNKNVLCTSRGVFLTLNHLLNEITKNKPTVSTLIVNSSDSSKAAHLANVTYTSRSDSKLLLLMVPDSRFGAQEALLLNKELVRTLEFTYQSLDRCFEDSANRTEVDHFFSRFFAKVLSNELWCNGLKTIEKHPPLIDEDGKSKLKTDYHFEDLLPAAHWISLPNEAQMQIDDALSELEASDYREWNEDPMDCQRLYTILGSALYHNEYLLASHFQWGDLIDVHCYCRQNGYFQLSKKEPVRSMVIWKEVYPFSCNRGSLAIHNYNTIVPEGRRYLLIVGNGQSLLTVLMEAGGCTEPAENGCGPDPFYVEEAEATLTYIQELGLIELAERWVKANQGSQVTLPENLNIRRTKSDFLGNIFNKSVSPTPLNKEPISTSPAQKVTSILKRRSPDISLGASTHNNTSGSSMFSLQSEDLSTGEDSVSQSGYSERSEYSNTEEPVLGRRAQRERNANNAESDESDSDWEQYRDGSQKSNSSYDLSELRQNLLLETEDLRPPRLTGGLENVLMHYVYLDSTEGLLIAPPDSLTKTANVDHVLNNFRSCSQSIHNLFSNTLRFKTMLAQDMAKSVVNKSLIAIKEHGVLFECPFFDENGHKVDKVTNVTYWVVGRLFHIPYPREVYLCYHESVPQSLVEFAFKLAVSFSI